MNRTHLQAFVIVAQWIPHLANLEDQQKKLSFHNLKTIKDIAKKFNSNKKPKKKYIKNLKIEKSSINKTSNKKFISLIISVLSIIMIFYLAYQNK